MPAPPVGLDAGGIEIFTGWLADRVEALAAPLSFAVLPGGRSNLTYTVTDGAARRWVLRRPPLSGVLPSAHNVVREHRILAALSGTAVPVPPVIGACESTDVIGAPFYVMEYVAGEVLASAADAIRMLTPAARRRATDGLADTLAALHQVEPAQVGLGDLGRPDGYVARQLERLGSQLRGPGQRPVPLLEEVGQRLARAVPPQRATAIVHGDYRIGNVIVDDDGVLRAVLDWELCTRGDPRADVAWLMTYWAPPAGQGAVSLSMATSAPGFGTAEDALRRYEAATGQPVADLDFFLAFAYWRMAVIVEGVHRRHRMGAYGELSDPVVAGEIIRLGDAALALAETADAAARRGGW